MAGGVTNALLETNRAFYDRLWSDSRLIGPERFNTWPLVQTLCAAAGLRLEVGPGLRPRLPVEGTVFADISLPALGRLRDGGGCAIAASLMVLPFADASFGLISAMDIVEHVEADHAAFAELARIAAPGAILLLSVPLHQSAWTAFDDAVGHCRRYDPGELVQLLGSAGFQVEQSAPSGMLPRSTRLQRVGMWFLARQRERAMWWYNCVFMPMGLRRAAPLALSAGMLPAAGLGGLLLVCRRTPSFDPAPSPVLHGKGSRKQAHYSRNRAGGSLRP